MSSINNSNVTNTQIQKTALTPSTDKPAVQAPATQYTPQAAPQKSDEVVLQDLLGMAAKMLEAKELGMKQEAEAKAQTPAPAAEEAAPVGKGKGKGKGKGAGFIPPGIAKKSADQLPDGNPWKAVLQQREADEAKKIEDAKNAEAAAAKKETQKQADDLEMQKLFMMIMEMISKLSQQHKTDYPATAPASIAVGEPAPADIVKEEPKADAPKDEAPVADAPKVDEPKAEISEEPKVEESVVKEEPAA